MAGALIAASAGTGGTINNVTVGQGSLELAETFYSFGFADTDPNWGSFGSISPGTWRGYTITALFWDELSQRLTFTVSGDASAYTGSLSIGGTSYALGTGSHSGGKTTYNTGTVANPFPVPTAIVPVTG